MILKIVRKAKTILLVVVFIWIAIFVYYIIKNYKMSKISEMREHYDRAILDEDNVDTNPMKQFHLWFEDAKKGEELEPNAMTLSTIDKYGNPASRIVLLKGLEDDKFIFFTNYESNKAKEIELNSNVALLFLWKNLQRQVRITGNAEKVSKEQSEAYFHSRPKGSQIGAWVSPQSQVIADKAVLNDRMERLNEKYKDVDQLPLPDFWGGYYLKPEMIEFWQGRPSRLHDRLRYSLEGDIWKIERIAP